MSKRIPSIDILRGLVMIIMALDHTRFFFSSFKYDPTNLQYAGAPIFLTRWITNFCAPVFVLLSGTSAFLSLTKAGSKKEASFKLFTRGFWLIILEVSFVRLGWTFDLKYNDTYLQVIWAIGFSMVALSVLIFLPRIVILTVGLLMIFGHNAMDGFHPVANTFLGTLWLFLHAPGNIAIGSGRSLTVLYPVIPWIGVMALGYCIGPVFKENEKRQQNAFLLTGFSALALFIVLRFINHYGDASLWQTQVTPLRTVLSFINCTKYPPSLLFLLMTLGPAFLLLPLIKNLDGKAANILLVYGKVPLFFYLVHIYVIHALAIIASHFIHNDITAGHFSHPGFSLPAVYAFWLAVIIILYLPCRWFMRIKMTHKKWWLSYL